MTRYITAAWISDEIYDEDRAPLQTITVHSQDDAVDTGWWMQQERRSTASKRLSRLAFAAPSTRTPPQ